MGRKIVSLCAVVCLMAFGAAAQQAAKVSGKWEMTWEGPQGPVTQTVNFEQDGEKLKGTITSTFQGQTRESALEGSIKGNKVSFTVKRETPRGEMVTEYSGTVEGDTMKGTMQRAGGGGAGGPGKGPGGGGPREWTAKRAK